MRIEDSGIDEEVQIRSRDTCGQECSYRKMPVHSNSETLKHIQHGHGTQGETQTTAWLVEDRYFSRAPPFA